MSTFYVYSSPYLAHHGVKGMKWGVRRYQNPDGSYTMAGKLRYGIGDKMEKDRQEAYKRYKKWGLSDKRALELSEEKKELLKKVAIGAGIAVGSAAIIAAAYYGGSYVRRNIIGVTIKAGTTLQTLSSDPNRLQTGEDFYAAFKNKDKTRYKALFGKDYFGGNKYNIQAEVTNNIKLAPRNKAANAMMDVINKDKDFADYVKESAKNTKDFAKLNPRYTRHAILANKLEKDPSRITKLTTQEKRLLYEMVNLNQTSHDPRAQSLVNELKSMGYQGMIDINDANRSGFNTDAAIIFNNSNVIQKGITQLKDTDIKNAQVKNLVSTGMETAVKVAPVASADIGIKTIKNKSEEVDLKAYNEAKNKRRTENE